MSASAPIVLVARPSLPPYLERVELVTRVGKGQLKIHEKDLWSEPLDAAVARVMAENIRLRTGSANIQPSGSFISRDYSSMVEIRIERFDPFPAGVLLLECTWKVQAVKSGEAPARVFRTEVAYELLGDSMSARIAAMNEALVRLSREIAGSL